MNQKSAGWFLAAFTLIGVSTVIEGVNDGFTVLDWVVVVLSVGFAGQAVWILSQSRSSRA